MPARNNNLTASQERFVQAYVLGTPGIAANGTRAAQSAGYAIRSARVAACRLLTKANVQRAVAALRAKRQQSSIADAQERDSIASAIARDERLDPIVRLLAIKELNKVEGRHSVRHLHEGKLTLEQALAMTKHPDDV